jgi:hypothetical protein
MEDNNSQPQRELSQLQEAQKAKTQLAQLLGGQLKNQRFGKFLSTKYSGDAEWNQALDTITCTSC